MMIAAVVVAGGDDCWQMLMPLLLKGLSMIKITVLVCLMLDDAAAAAAIQ